MKRDCTPLPIKIKYTNRFKTSSILVYMILNGKGHLSVCVGGGGKGGIFFGLKKSPRNNI